MYNALVKHAWATSSDKLLRAEKRRKDSRKHTKQGKTGLLQDLWHENLTGLINLSQGTKSYTVQMPGHAYIRLAKHEPTEPIVQWSGGSSPTRCAIGDDDYSAHPDPRDPLESGVWRFADLHIIPSHVEWCRVEPFRQVQGSKQPAARSALLPRNFRQSGNEHLDELYEIFKENMDKTRENMIKRLMTFFSAPFQKPQSSRRKKG